MTRKAAFTQSDISKVMKGLAAAGVSATRIEIEPDGRIVAQLGKPGDNDEDQGDEWTRRINARREARTAGKRH